jgi:uncharacterized protein (DUF1810 family)
MYNQAIQEMKHGKKISHWMWFVFPQALGQGKSETSQVYGLTEREAKRYLQHRVLGTRLRDSIDEVTNQIRRGSNLTELFGEVDAAKFVSCMRLFTKVAPWEFSERWDRLVVASTVQGIVKTRRNKEKEW